MTSKVTIRDVPADLVEATPGSGAIGQWLLASPLLIFLAWAWVDLFSHYSPLPWYWLDALLALVLFAFVIVLPLGVLAHTLVTAVPGLFQKAGWDGLIAKGQMPVTYEYGNRWMRHASE